MAYIQLSFVYMCIYIYIQICIFVTEYILSKEKFCFLCMQLLIIAYRQGKYLGLVLVRQYSHCATRAKELIILMSFHYDYIQLVCMNVSFLRRLLSTIRRKKREEKKRKERKTESGWQTNAESYSLISHNYAPVMLSCLTYMVHRDISMYVHFSFSFFLFFLFHFSSCSSTMSFLFLYISRFATDDLAINRCCLRWPYHYHHCSIWFFWHGRRECCFARINGVECRRIDGNN